MKKRYFATESADQNGQWPVFDRHDMSVLVRFSSRSQAREHARQMNMASVSYEDIAAA